MNTQKTHFLINKAAFQLAAWGLVVLIAGALSQYFNLSADFLLWLWGGATLLGITAQIGALVRGVGLNLGIWLGVIGAGWLFTFYVTKMDNGAHADLYPDLPGVWLILLGVGYLASAFQLDKRFLIIAAIHLVAGGLLELSARRILAVDFLDANGALLLGLVGGLPLLVAALPFWYGEPRVTKNEQRATSGEQRVTNLGMEDRG
jgi:hypothetical protein